MNKTPLLSVCIPTFNRASILDRSLEVLTHNSSFNDNIEVIIVDNCSTDETPSIIKKYTEKHKNIVAYRNSKNIQENSFVRVLSYATGEYLKICNDYTILDENCLSYIIDKINKHKEDKTPLFFLNGRATPLQEEIQCKNLDEYIMSASIFVTYLPFFGVWRDQWKKIINKHQYCQTKLPQDAWTYQIIINYGKCIIYNQEILKMVPEKHLGIRRGYNWFEIFFDNYFKILSDYQNLGYISPKTIKKEKKKVFIHFKPQLEMTFFIRYNKYWAFDTTGTLKRIWHHYKKEPIFYLGLIYSPISFLHTLYKYLRYKISTLNN